MSNTKAKQHNPSSKFFANFQYIFVVVLVIIDIHSWPQPWDAFNSSVLLLGYYALFILVFAIELHLYRTDGNKKRASIPFATLLCYNVFVLGYQPFPLFVAVVGVSVFALLWFRRSIYCWNCNENSDALEYFVRRGVGDAVISATIASVYIFK